MTTSYKKPRPINLVSLCFYALVAGGIYAGWKFIPVYYASFKVDSVLTDIGYRAADLRHMSTEQQQTEGMRLLNGAVLRIRELGVEDPELRVYFGSGFNSVYADYTVVVQHPFDKSTVLRFARKSSVPGGGGPSVNP